MYDYNYQNGTSVGRVCLEIGLKPFGYDKTPEGYRNAAREFFSKWSPLLKYATGCSVLMWTSDGSEILDYTGNLSDEFEWCKYVGIGNWDRTKTPETPENPADYSLHKYPIFYKENPPAMTYGDLKDIIYAIKEVGKELTGFDIEVGETFDPGPEFAYSSFKYERHPEICKGNIMGAKKWIHCASRLHADNHAYCAYPDGIPEGTHFGEFLGRQFMAMKRDLGFDYIWLSNGFGFSLSSWHYTGEVFDGESFDFSGAADVRDSIKEFWDHFLSEIGDTRVETRGSNLSSAMDISAHGCPIDEIYDVPNLVSPPNSPWAALNSRFGLELVGYMSHIAETARRGYAFRYYTHDIWWYNSPWFDRYNRSPHDIYLPLSVARLDENGNVIKPQALDFLSVDDSFGRIPDRCSNEVIPHILTAYNDFPDKPGLVTWVYPFDEYCRMGLREGNPQKIFSDDWFIESAVDFGFPVNTVISDRSFASVCKSKLMDTILTMPVPEGGSKLEASLLEAASAGAKVILYGGLKKASDKVRELCGIRLSKEGIDGKLNIETELISDKAEINGYGSALIHDSLVSDGEIFEIADDCEALASVSKDGIMRTYASVKKNVVWIRSSFPHIRSKGQALPPLYDPTEAFPPALLMRGALKCFGYHIGFNCYDIKTKLPILLLSRCRGMTMFNMYAADTTVRMNISTENGAPAPNGCEFILENDMGEYSVSKWMHNECRIFVKQKNRSRISCRIDAPVTYLSDKLYVLDGLSDATVMFYADKGDEIIPRQSSDIYDIFLGANVDYSYDEGRGCYVIPSLTGSIYIAWRPKKSIGWSDKLDFLRNGQ